MVSEEAGFPISAVNTPTTIKMEKGDVCERASSFLIEYADIFLRVAKKGGRQTASQLVDLITIKFSELGIITRYIKKIQIAKKSPSEIKGSS